MWLDTGHCAPCASPRLPAPGALPRIGQAHCRGHPDRHWRHRRIQQRQTIGQAAQASISVSLKVAPVSGSGPKYPMSAVPICATGSPTMPNGSSHMSRLSRPIINGKKQQSPGKGAGQRALSSGLRQNHPHDLSYPDGSDNLHTQEGPKYRPILCSETKGGLSTTNRSSVADWVVRGNLVAPLVPAEVGKTRAFVQVPHRSRKPGQRTEGPKTNRENQHRTYEDRSGAL